MTVRTPAAATALIDRTHARLELVHGECFGPEFSAAIADAIRARLERHKPCNGHQGASGYYAHPGGQVCHTCDNYWPCPDVLADLAILGINPDQEPDQ